MKKEEAEKLVCPFMSSIQNNFGTLANEWSYEVKTNQNVTCNTNCITTKCMAWKVDVLHDKMLAYKNYSGELPILEALDICYEDGYCMRLER